MGWVNLAKKLVISRDAKGCGGFNTMRDRGGVLQVKIVIQSPALIFTFISDLRRLKLSAITLFDFHENFYLPMIF